MCENAKVALENALKSHIIIRSICWSCLSCCKRVERTDQKAEILNDENVWAELKVKFGMRNYSVDNKCSLFENLSGETAYIKRKYIIMVQFMEFCILLAWIQKKQQHLQHFQNQTK